MANLASEWDNVLWNIKNVLPGMSYRECPRKRPLSGRVVRSFEIQVAKEESMLASPDLTSWILTISRLYLCEFTPDCLSNQWSLGTGETKLVAGKAKCSSGWIWYCSGCRGVEKLSEETQKCHRVGFHRVYYRGVLS